MYVGYVGGFMESLVMRVTDIMLIFPTIMLSIVIVTIAGPSEGGVIVALALSQVPKFIRIARGVTLSVKEEPYVEASIAVGAGPVAHPATSYLAEHLLAHHRPGNSDASSPRSLGVGPSASWVWASSRRRQNGGRC